MLLESSHLRLSMHNAQTKKEEIKQEFDQWVRSGHSKEMKDRHQFLWDGIWEAGQFQKNSIVLDLCCGEGWAAIETAKKVDEGIVVGLDISGAMIERALKNSRPTNAIFLNSDVSELSFGSNQFTHIYSIEALYYIEKIESLIKDVYRCLQYGGKFLVAINYYSDNSFTTRWPLEINIPLYNRTETEYKSLMRSVGFKTCFSKRLFDPKPLPASYNARWFKDIEELRGYYSEGALLLCATK